MQTCRSHAIKGSSGSKSRLQSRSRFGMCLVCACVARQHGSRRNTVTAARPPQAMGSLFRAREAWSVKFEDEAGFDSRSLAVCNVDNAADGQCKRL